AGDDRRTMTDGRDGRVARTTLARPERGTGITLEMPAELAACVERANLDPAVHAIALAGNGRGFCGGYDLVAAEQIGEAGPATGPAAPGREAGEARPVTGPAAPGREAEEAARSGFGSPLDPATVARNPAPGRVGARVVDFKMMSRNVRGFMSLFHSEKPVVCKVHGFCVAGGTDMALCSDLLVIEDGARIGYPPARVWGVPTTALWA